jgi:hypothetical protein
MQALNRFGLPKIAKIAYQIMNALAAMAYGQGKPSKFSLQAAYVECYL